MRGPGKEDDRLLLKVLLDAGMVAHPFNPALEGYRGRWTSESEVKLAYKTSSRPVRVME